MKRESTSAGGVKWRVGLAVAWSVLAAASVVGAAVRLSGIGQEESPPRVQLANGVDGEQLYLRYCASCHGLSGAGDGEAAYLLNPRARDFTSGRFRLVSTRNGVPTESDLIQTLQRGMPGSAMPPWDWMSKAQLTELAKHVLRLAEEGLAKEMITAAEEFGDELTLEEARGYAQERLVPGESIAVPSPLEMTPVTSMTGRRLYNRMCRSCHGDNGRGEGVEEQRNEDGTRNYPRDFTAGVFKGGADHTALVRRIAGGMPGSPMPAATLADPGQAAYLAAYVQSLVAPGAQERSQSSQRTIAVPRVDELPAGCEDAVWTGVEPVWVALTPLWWRNDRVEGLLVRAVHDGERVAVHMSWEDGERDDELLGMHTFSDAAAIMLAAAEEPPNLLMGSWDDAVEIGYWKAAWEREREAARGMSDRFPLMMPDPFAHALPGSFSSLLLTARAVGNTQALPRREQAAESLSARGFGTLTTALAASAWQASSQVSEDGFWEVLFVRPLNPAGSSVSIVPGDRLFTSFAVWDGEAGDRNGQKSVTVWQKLELER